MRLLFLLLSGLFLTGCEERANIPIVAEETGLLVVEGVVTNESRNHLIKLSRPYWEQNGVSAPVSGASVHLFEDTILFTLAELPPGSGNYYTPLLRGLTEKLYTLYIQHNGKIYTAQDSPVAVEPMNPLSYSETGVGYALNPDTRGDDPSYTEHNITWGHTGGCQAGASCSGRVVFYDLRTADVNQIFKPDQETVYFPHNSIVVRRKYSVSPRYKAFLRSMLSETQWRGGAFDVERSNVSTNLSEGAVGFFAVCSVVADTTIIE